VYEGRIVSISAFAGGLLADVQAQVERDLIVARTRRVQHSRRLSQGSGEPGLDRHMHVFLGGQLRRVDVP